MSVVCDGKTNVEIAIDPRDVAAIFTHAPCVDGALALMVFRMAWNAAQDDQSPEALLHFSGPPPLAGFGHGNDEAAILPQLAGKTVLFSDISPSAAFLAKLEAANVKVLIDDHHDLSKQTHLEASPAVVAIENHVGVSACMSMWLRYFKDAPVPAVLRHVSAADTFAFEAHNVQKDDALAVQRALKSSILPNCLDPAFELTPLIVSGKTLIVMEKARRVNLLQCAMTVANEQVVTPQGTFTVRGVDSRMEMDHVLWTPVAEDFFGLDHDAPPDVLAFYTMATPWEKGATKVVLRRDNNRNPPINLATFAANYPGGGGHSGAASFTVEADHATNIPFPSCMPQSQ